MSKLPKQITADNISTFINSFDNVLTDCDGVLWSSAELIPGANISLNKLKSLGKRVFYLTNNSTKTRESLLQKCNNLGYNGEMDEMVTTAYILCEYLKSINFKKKIYLVGVQALANELEKIGIPVTGPGVEPIPDDVFSMQHHFTPDTQVGAVVVAFDGNFNYCKCMKAATYLKDDNCLFLATNTDEAFPVENKNIVFPGTGMAVKAVETVTGRHAKVLGKPNKLMFDIISAKYNLDPKRTIMIGDRCNTDILFGKNCGLQTLSVLTGVTSWSHIEKWAADDYTTENLADYYLESLGDLHSLIT